MNASHPAAFSSGTLLVLGCGYVGRTVVETALQRGYRVVALTRNPGTAAALRERGAETIVADLASYDWHRLAPAAPAVVLNCVAGGGAGLEGYRHAYLDGMRSVDTWLRGPGAGSGLFVYTSSTSVYPQGGGAAVSEDAPIASSAEESSAGILAATEEVIGGFPSGACAQKVILRLAGIYGPSRTHLVEQVKQGAVAGRGEVHLNLIHLDDIVAALWAVAARRETIRETVAVFNVADDGAALKAEVVAWLAARLGVPAPAFSGIPAGRRQRMTPDRIVLNTRLKRDCGWQPRYPTFREGYAAVLAGG